MSKKMKIAAQNIEAILEALANANCPKECRCIFCRTFDHGYKAGLEDAEMSLRRQVRDFASKVGTK